MCGGESHQLQTCPKLPLSQKVEVLVEKFDATGVTKVQSGNISNPVAPSVNESWVTVSPKKRVKAMIPAKPRGNSLLNSERENKVGRISHPSSSMFTPYHNPAPLGPEILFLLMLGLVRVTSCTALMVTPWLLLIVVWRMIPWMPISICTNLRMWTCPAIPQKEKGWKRGRRLLSVVLSDLSFIEPVYVLLSCHAFVLGWD